MPKFFLPLLVLLLSAAGLSAQQEADYYQIEKITVPDGVALEVGGMDFMADGRLAVCTRRGEVWLIGDLEDQATYTRFARGLHEPLGLAVKDGAIYVSQRGEVTKLTDSNDDDRADLFETVYELPLTGNYHEYHYGPLFRPDGSMLTTLNVGWEGKGVSKSKWRGWMLQYDPQENKIIPYAAGMRSPAGFGTNAEGDVFVAENQGDWIGSGRITHLAKGDFAGHPASLAWADQDGSTVALREAEVTDEFQTMYRAKAELPGLKLPAVWFPHGILGISTAAIITDRTEGGFGPFTNQMFVSDQGQSKIMRVALEKVNGEYQGAVFPFVEGFSSGLLRLSFNQDNTLYAGQTARGWAATGGEEFALERLRWTGKVPFEMYKITAAESGFLIEFTAPVDAATVRNSSFTVQNFTYRYHHNYGSPTVDIQANPVSAATLEPDGKTVRLTLADFRPGYIYEVKVSGVRAAAGTRLLHDFAYYTLNAIPGQSGADAGAVATTEELGAEASSAKHPTTMPSDWNGKVDTDLLLESAKGMKFKQTYLTVKAGAKVRLTFRNPDDMQHNFVLTSGKKGDKVGQAAGELGLQGLAMNYVPDMEDVLVHTILVEPEMDDVIYFRAPTQPGLYEYVCTVPGHYQQMRGVLKVE
ncbi:plastocyanin/azurin family copper-binding protein [Neolewinella lacunae]|uniref:Auracyanin family protein n=1 Tax=Neolewinella lacunae TaxID=1517758 RepID=A0A923PJ81_9BACT|nr:plastocyanin/azurin family copper-binding protein [Neolewinella lacunae]MBC6993681.1 auracyanin family protein [Neolewinella lacunae]MDN3636376.1 plastocyanin/azurin family copper-binding protein [Neolewinella lacunae]